MKALSMESLTGYGSRVRVLFDKTGRDSDETTIDIDFSRNSFPDIFASGAGGSISIRASGSIEQTEILEAFRSVVKMLES